MKKLFSIIILLNILVLPLAIQGQEISINAVTSLSHKQPQLLHHIFQKISTLSPVKRGAVAVGVPLLIGAGALTFTFRALIKTFFNNLPAFIKFCFVQQAIEKKAKEPEVQKTLTTFTHELSSAFDPAPGTL